MLEKLNCTCGQNVMVSGLKSVDNVWKCRTCIKNEGATLQTVNAIGQYEILEERLNKRNEYIEEALSSPKYSNISKMKVKRIN